MYPENILVTITSMETLPADLVRMSLNFPPLYQATAAGVVGGAATLGASGGATGLAVPLEQRKPRLVWLVWSHHRDYTTQL